MLLLGCSADCPPRTPLPVSGSPSSLERRFLHPPGSSEQGRITLVIFLKTYRGILSQGCSMCRASGQTVFRIAAIAVWKQGRPMYRNRAAGAAFRARNSLRGADSRTQKSAAGGSLSAAIGLVVDRTCSLPKVEVRAAGKREPGSWIHCPVLSRSYSY